MAITANLGFPRIGAQRELKKALESYWKGQTTAEQLQSVAAELRQHHWKQQQDAGIAHIPSNDFSLYDQVLDTTAMMGAIPERYGYAGGDIFGGWILSQMDLAAYVHARKLTHTKIVTVAIDNIVFHRQEQVTEGRFTFVAIGEGRKPVPVGMA